MSDLQSNRALTLSDTPHLYSRGPFDLQSNRALTLSDTPHLYSRGPFPSYFLLPPRPMEGEDIRVLWCLVDGDIVPFGVRVATSSRVSYLKEMIKQTGITRDIPDSSLVLWKVTLNDPEPVNPEDNLVERIRNKGDVTKFATKLSVTEKVSKLFPQPPLEEHVNILVQLPSKNSLLSTSPFRKHPYSSPAEDEVHEAKRKRTASHEPIQMLSSDHPLHELWTRAREPQPTLFKTRTVQRDDNPTKTKLPSKYMVLKGENWVQKLQGKPSFTNILIRDEYKEALRAIKELFLHGKVTDSTVEVDDTMEVDDKEPAPLENPFLDDLTGPIIRTGGVVLLGHPGIGKTVFLYVLLVLRLQARLPTIYQSRDTHLYYFDNNGVSRISLTQGLSGTDFESHFDPSTWCLIDSNENLNTVPIFIQDLDRFKVQASSPRPYHFDWVKKASRKVFQYFMKSWSLSELLVGRMLQCERCTEEQIDYFFHNYGTSARLVYLHASDPLDYKTVLMSNLAQLTYDEVGRLASQTSALDLSGPVSHQIVLISPDTSRNTFTYSFPSCYIYEAIRDKLCNERLEATARLYDIFVRIPKARSAVGMMLEDAVNDVFHKGGEWSLVSMEKSLRKGPKNTHWKDPKGSTTPQYLHLGYDRKHITIDSNPNPDGTRYKPLEVVSFLHGAQLQLRDGYYLPSSPSEETFDAFIYESAHETATIFQVTVSETHFVKEGDIKWLQGLGVKKFQYIAVSTPNALDLPFPNAWDTLISKKYLLIVNSLPRHIP